MKDKSTEFIKESIKFETEKLKIYATIFVALVAYLVSVIKGIPDLQNLSNGDSVNLFVTVFAMVGFLIAGGISLWQVRILFRLLEKKPLP